MKKHLPTVVSVLAVIGFLITVGTYIYTSGQKDQRIKYLELTVKELRLENKEIKESIDGTVTQTQKVDTKLTLLLDYFGIVSEPRGHN